MDLSKTFDTIPYHLSSKINAYRMQRQALELITSYLLECKQRVKLRSCTSSWTAVNKGVHGPMLLITLSMIFLLVLRNQSSLIMLMTIQYLPSVMIFEPSKIFCLMRLHAVDWFKINLMVANAEKFQFTLLGKNVCDETEYIEFSDVKIGCEPEVKLLGVKLDYKLSFNTHINNLASKARAQLSALTRIKRFLDQDSKLTLAKTFITSHFVYCSAV